MNKDDFLLLVAEFLDAGDGCAEDLRVRLNDALRAHPDWRADYLVQIRLHALLRRDARLAADAAALRHRSSGRRLWKRAAALLILSCGLGLALFAATAIEAISAKQKASGTTAVPVEEGRASASLPSTAISPSSSAADPLAEVAMAAADFAATVTVSSSSSDTSAPSEDSASSVVQGNTNMNANTTKKLATALVAATAAAVTASAANTWQGPDGGDWATAANWSSGAVPTTEAIAINGPTSLVSSVNATSGVLTLGGSGDVNFNFGTNSYTAGGVFAISSANLRFSWLSGIWNQTGQSLYVGSFDSKGHDDELLISGPGSMMTNANINTFIGTMPTAANCGLVVSNGATLVGCAFRSRGTNNYMRFYDATVRRANNSGSFSKDVNYGTGLSLYATNSYFSGISFSSDVGDAFVFSNCILTNGDDGTFSGLAFKGDAATYVFENGSKLFTQYPSLGLGSATNGTYVIFRGPGTCWDIGNRATMSIYWGGEQNASLIVSNGACLCNASTGILLGSDATHTNNQVRLDGAVVSNVSIRATGDTAFLYVTNSFICGTGGQEFGGRSVIVDSIVTNVAYGSASAGQCFAISNSSCWFGSYGASSNSTLLIADGSSVNFGACYPANGQETFIVENATLACQSFQAGIWSASNMVLRLAGTNPVFRVATSNLKLQRKTTLEFVVPAKGYAAAPFQQDAVSDPTLDGTAVLSLNAKAFSNEGGGLVHLMTNTVGKFTTDFFAETNGLPAGSTLIGGKGYPYLDAQIHGTRTGFTIRICDNTDSTFPAIIPRQFGFPILPKDNPPPAIRPFLVKYGPWLRTSI